MRPGLSKNGLIIAAQAAVFVITGSLLSLWPLVALGFVEVAALLVLYVLFIPYAAMFRRRLLEFAWWVPAGEASGGALVADRPVRLHLLFRNHSPLRIHRARLTVHKASGLQISDPRAGLPLALSARRETHLELSVTPRAAGYWHFHGAALRIDDRFRAFVMDIYFPSPLQVKVFPALALPRQQLSFRPETGPSDEKAGLRVLRQRGLGSHLRELREHLPGDPFKHIAWKATARTGKLMVRQYESEILVTHELLLDISPSMRKGAGPGRTALDTALVVGASLARLALEAGDRIGLTTFDTRIYSRLKSGDGTPQLYRILEQLMGLHSVVDEDLTDITDAELCSAVSDYLAYQQGADVRIKRAPPRSSPRWDDIVIGARGELLDFDLLLRLARRSLRRARLQPAHLPPVRASDDRVALLRTFCRDRGIELRYRVSELLRRKDQGVARALSQVAMSRGSRALVLISDLQELELSPQLVEAIQLARRHRHRLLVIVPRAVQDQDTSEDPTQQRIRRIFAMRDTRSQRQIQRKLRALGARVIVVDSPRQLARLFANARRPAA